MRTRTMVVIANTIKNQSRRPSAILRRSVATGQKVRQNTQVSRSEPEASEDQKWAARSELQASAGQQAATLFAYGTLRRGAPMHGLLEGRTTWIGAARVEGRLVDLGAFPGLVPPLSPGDRVYGDLFEIAEAEREALLDALDRYEGASFARVQQQVDGPDGPAVAWLYVYRGDLDDAKVLASGDYLAAR